MNDAGFGISTGGGSGSSSSVTTTIPYGAASGTDTYTVTLSPAITSYNTGLVIEVKFTNTNATTTPTVNANSLGAKTIVGMNGVALYAGQITASGTYYLTYDGTNFILVTSPNSSSNNMSYGVATGTDTYAVALSPPISAYLIGQLISVKITNTNATITPTLNVNSLGAKTIVGTSGATIPVGQLNANGTYYFLYDGTNMVLQAGMMDRKDVNYYRKTGTTTLERWYTSATQTYAATTVALGSNVLRATPFVVSKAITLDRIAMEITSAGTGGSLVRLGIYDSVNGLPTNLILDAGTIAGDSATFQSITINQSLQPNLYYLVWITNTGGTITFRGISVNTGIPSILGVSSTLGAGNSANLITSAFTYGSLPNPFDNTSITATGLNIATVSVRLSA